MFQHATPCEFNPQNQDCICCASLFLSISSPSWPGHQNPAGIAQMLLAGTSFGQRNFWEFWEGVRVSHSLCSPSPSLQGFCSCWRDGTSSNWGKFLCLLPSHPQKFLLHPTALPAPQIQENELNLGELGCPWVLQLGWRGCFGIEQLGGGSRYLFYGKKNAEKINGNEWRKERLREVKSRLWPRAAVIKLGSYCMWGEVSPSQLPAHFQHG